MRNASTGRFFNGLLLARGSGIRRNLQDFLRISLPLVQVLSGELLPSINTRNSTSPHKKSHDDTARSRKPSPIQLSPTIGASAPKRSSLSPVGCRERLEPLDYSQWTQSGRIKNRNSDSDLHVTIPLPECDSPSSSSSSPCMPSISLRRSISHLATTRKSIKILEPLLHRTRRLCAPQQAALARY